MAHPRRLRKWLLVSGLGAVLVVETLGLARYLWLDFWAAHGATAEQRGMELALRLGCFACHGAGGVQGMKSPLGEVPAWDGGNWMMYAPQEEDIRNWILYGNRSGKPTQEPEPGKIAMPAFKGRITHDQLEDLVAFYKAVAWYRQPDDPRVERGRELAEDLGCHRCHGPEGRFSLRNPGSFKGYIPAWNSKDFEELVRDDQELRAWILDGMPPRLRNNPAARVFLQRQVIRMPAYRGHITEDQLTDLVRYIRWVRSQP